MAGTWKTMVNFAVRLPNQPGELARFSERLREADINLVGLWGYAPGQDEPWISCVPELPDAFRAFLNSSNLRFEEGKTLAAAKAFQDATDFHLQHPNPEDWSIDEEKTESPE